MRIPRALLAVAVLGLLAAACAEDGETVPATGAADGSAVASLPPAPTMARPSSPGAGTLPVGSAPTTVSAADATSVPAPTDPAPTDPPPPTPESLAGAAVRLTEVASLRQPVDLVSRPGDPTGLHVAERVGVVTRIDGTERSTVLDLQDQTEAQGEQGLLGLAYAADGAHLYVHYTDNDGNTVVEEFAVGADGTADRGSGRTLLTLRQPFPNHNGGEVVIGPDGLLYVGLGDGGSGGDPLRAGLDLDNWLGKILRIDPTAADGDQPYGIPPGNPFAAGGGRPEIFSFGLRNPWRFSFDPVTGDLWVADVGQNEVEEVNFVPASLGSGWGANFGWSAWEGTRRYNDDQPAGGALAPVHEYEHGDLGCSVTGGEVYRGTAVPALQGAYLFADYCVPGIRAIPAAAGPWDDAVALSDTGASISGFGRGPDGEVYVLSLDGPVYRIDPA